MAASCHFGFWLLTNSAAIFARVMGAKFFLNTSKSSNQVSNLTMLSVVTGPPDCTQLICVCAYICIYIYMYLYVYTVYPGWHARGFVVLCFVVVVQSFIMNSHEVFILIHQGCVAGTGAVVRLPQCRSPAWWIWEDQSMYNHGRAQRGRSRVRVSWDILCVYLGSFWVWTWPVRGGVILKRRLSVAGPIPGMIPEDICEF